MYNSNDGNINSNITCFKSKMQLFSVRYIRVYVFIGGIGRGIGFISERGDFCVSFARTSR